MPWTRLTHTHELTIPVSMECKVPNIAAMSFENDRDSGTSYALRSGANVAIDDIKVLIADDHTLILDVVTMALANSPDLVLSTAPSVDGALACIAEKGSFDLILLDLDMPGMNGVETLKQVRAANEDKPDRKSVV